VAESLIFLVGDFPTMSPASTRSDPADAPGVEDLARSIRAGLEMRRFQQMRLAAMPAPATVPEVRPLLEPLSEVVRSDARAQLQPLAGLVNHPAAARPGKISGLIRLLRRALKKFMNPWLDVQTRFNQGTIDALESSSRALHDQARFNRATVETLDGCMRALQAQLNQVQSHVHLSLQSLTTYLNDCSHSLQAEREEQEHRVADLVRSLREQVDEAIEKLEDRFAQHVRGCKAQMEVRTQQAVVQAVNRELGAQGEIAKAGLLFSHPCWIQIQNQGPRIIQVSERILENIFVHSRLPAPPGRLLDLGCAESINAIEMASLGFQVVGVDLRRLPLEHPNFEMVQANIAKLPFPDGSFDVVVSLSTIEHVGLGWYTQEEQGNSDHRVIAEAARVLRPGGRFLLTVPFGRGIATPVHRIYDPETLTDLLRPFRVLERALGVRAGDAWTYTTDEQRASEADSKDRVSAVALVVAEKP
jgi:SAM-dependent methyltransferase